MPNSDLTSTAVRNYSVESLRRVDLYFCAPYDVSTADAKKAILEAVAADKRILEDPAPFVRLFSYEDNPIKYTTRVWCKNADCWDVYFDLNENVREAFARNGFAMNHEHINVHILEK